MQNRFKNFNASRYTKYFLSFSLTFLLIGAILLCIFGFNLGMDFTGGSTYEVAVGDITTAEYDTLKQNLGTVVSNEGVSYTISTKDAGADKVMEIKCQTQDEVVQQTIFDNLTAATTYSVTSTGFQGATTTGETLTSAFIAIFLALVAMLIYIAIRFELISGVAALVALMHDVLMMCAFVVLCRIEINASFVAAIITILGYSINNTIIIFDRIRENNKMPDLQKVMPKDLADLSVRQTMRRTINTALTTIFAIVLLAIIGVPSMRQFVLPILIGLIVGTYSSIFISPQLWSFLISRSKKLDKKRMQKRDGDSRVTANTNVVEAEATPIQ
ncbi:MAG: protein translocase subunit SecF [Clostridia bacterium]|nr:protein translocase subunit SecF [Clostridia bacterium]